MRLLTGARADTSGDLNMALRRRHDTTMRRSAPVLLALGALLTSGSAARADSVSREIVNEVIIERPIEDVFQFTTTAENWKLWHPNTLDTDGADDHSATVGEEIIEYVRFFRIPGGKFFWTVSEHRENATWELVGEAEGGLIRFVLTYSFSTPRFGQTRFRRKLVCSMDKQGVNAIVLWSLGPYLRVSSELAVRNLKAMLESR